MPSKTKEKLIKIAEMLFAERGLEGVSMRDITTASGQKNASALNYHFGSREGLLQAIIDYRTTEIDQERQKMLDALDASGREDDLRTLVDIKIRPSAETLFSLIDGEKNHFVRFMVQIHASPSADFFHYINSKSESAHSHVVSRIRKLLSDIPPEILDTRLDIVLPQSAIAICRVERKVFSSSISKAAMRAALSREIDNLVDMQVGSLTAQHYSRTW